MASNQQAWMGTPAFELFRRGLITQSIIHFRGLNAYTSLPALGPEWAQDLLNVIVSGSGGLSKFRLPIQLSAAVPNQTAGPGSFWDFQQTNGTRQVLATFGPFLYYYTLDLSVVTEIEVNPLNKGQWSFSIANNILYGANGQRMQKWTGSAWQQWGIYAPTVAPNTVVAQSSVSLTRSSNVVTATLAPGSAMPAVTEQVLIGSAADASFDGSFTVVSANYSAYTFTYAQTGGNTSTTAVMGMNSEAFEQPISSITRNNGIVTATVVNTTRVPVGAYIYVNGVTDTSFNNVGANGEVPFLITAKTPTTLSWAQAGATATSSGGSIHFGLAPTFGYQWKYAYGNSVTGHVSNVSPATVLSAIATAPGGLQFTVNATPSPDPQVDTYYWFRTLDGGGDFYLLTTTTVPTILDTAPDSVLDQTKQGPLINNPPVQGLYTAVGQNRVVVFNLVGDSSGVIYSGYDQIYLGNPAESFPPNNRFELSIGAESIAGGGILHAGIVAFSQTGRMYMLRGQLEDVTLAIPVNFSAYLEELPWTLGCLSHFTIQTTPYGLVWLAGDKTLQLFDGHNEPVDISVGVYPLLRQITPGTESQCVASYFNWLERDWYSLLACVNGSLTPNRLFMFAFNKVLDADPTQANTLIESIESFVCDIPATFSSPAQWVGIITTSKLQRMLCISSGGYIQQLPVSSDTVNGLNLDPTIIPSTSGALNAYWRGGYFGGDSPQRVRTWRWARLNSDQDPSAFRMTMRLVDYQTFTYIQPRIVGPTQLQPAMSRMGVNLRAPRMSVEIDFPAADQSANVVELEVANIATSDR